MNKSTCIWLKGKKGMMPKSPKEEPIRHIMHWQSAILITKLQPPKQQRRTHWTALQKNNRNIKAAIWAEDVEAKTVEGMFNEAQVPFNQNGKNSFAFTVDLCNFISCVRQVDTSVLHGERLTNLTTVYQLWEFIVTALELPEEEDKDAALFRQRDTTLLRRRGSKNWTEGYSSGLCRWFAN